MQADRRARGSAARDPRLWLGAVALTLVAALAFRAALNAYFMLDDFGMLAIARFVDNPLEAFVRQHIPGGLYYRPLGMLLWWLSVRAFGTDPLAHYLINLSLHLGVAGALWALLARLCDSRGGAFVVAAIFACHPIAIGTTLWLSDRFDLLALLFCLLGLRAAVGGAKSVAPSVGAATLLLSLGLLSKEIALAGFAATAVLWLRTDRDLSWRWRIRACALLSLPVLACLVVRTLILPSPAAGPLIKGGQTLALFLTGMGNWWAGWIDYATFWAWMEGWKQAASLAGFGLLAALAVYAAAHFWNLRRQQTVLAGATLWLSPALLQWPLLGHFGVGLASRTDALEAVVNARYFHASLAGALILVGALLIPVAVRSPRFRGLVLVACALLLVPWFSASQTLARQHRTQTLRGEAIVQAATGAIDAIDIPAVGCQIYLLDVGMWSFDWISDEAVKAIYPDLRRIESCLIQTERTPWYHIATLRQPVSESVSPMSLMRSEDPAIHPIGRGQFLALNLDARTVMPAQSVARFLSWQGGRFVGVTAEVRDGRRRPAFQCSRPVEECPE